MIRFLAILLISASCFAQTPEQLSERNAFPDEIIVELNKENSTEVLDVITQIKTIRVGVISSLLKRPDNPNLYDFTIAFDDGSVLTITQDNAFNLVPNDVVKTALEKGLTRILGKVSN